MNTLSTEIASFARAWSEAGIFPAERQPAAPFDVDEYTRAALKKQRLESFRNQCPAEFQKPIDRTLLPNLIAWDEADLWNGSHPGLWIWSKGTGQAKSRLLWRQFGRLHVQHGRSILKTSGQSLAEEYFGFHMDGDPRGFYRWLAGYDLLFIDDLDKINLSDGRSPRMLREVFDELYACKKSVLVTANEPIEFFAKNVGQSCARRMREVCREIEF